MLTLFILLEGDRSMTPRYFIYMLLELFKGDGGRKIKCMMALFRKLLHTECYMYILYNPEISHPKKPISDINVYIVLVILIIKF